MPDASYKRWSETELDLLSHMIGEQRSIEFMSDCLHRSMQSVIAKIARRPGDRSRYFGDIRPPIPDVDQDGFFARARRACSGHLQDILCVHGFDARWPNVSPRTRIIKHVSKVAA